jgi:hypothetical protein
MELERFSDIKINRRLKALFSTVRHISSIQNVAAAAAAAEDSLLYTFTFSGYINVKKRKITHTYSFL